jgi:lipopolysaccharide/colanic/teichoic acid biosynthesis glycosyltransferase
MHPEADDILTNLLDKNESIKHEYEKNHKIKNDPRITRIGKF